MPCLSVFAEQNLRQICELLVQVQIWLCMMPSRSLEKVTPYAGPAIHTLHESGIPFKKRLLIERLDKPCFSSKALRTGCLFAVKVSRGDPVKRYEQQGRGSLIQLTNMPTMNIKDVKDQQCSINETKFFTGTYIYNAGLYAIPDLCF